MTLKRHPLFQWIVLFLLMMLFSWVTGRLQARTVPDSLSYVQYPFDSLDKALRSTRTIGYPLLLRVIGSAFGMNFVPTIQVLIHSIASWWMLRELMRWQLTATVCWAAAWAIAFCSTMIDNVSIVSTDCVAASLGVMTAVSLLAWARHQCLDPGSSGQVFWKSLTVALFACLAISMRPAYLSLIAWLPLAGTLILTMRYTDKPSLRLVPTIRSSSILGGLVLLPILAWVGLRGFVVGDYAILPFGHQNLAGVTIQLVNDEELAATAAPSDELAKRIISLKNTGGESARNLFAKDDRSTVAMESRWDDYVWHVVVPAAAGLYGDDTIANHDAIGAMNRDIIRRFPFRYGRWLLLAMRRAIWGTTANIAMHPIFLPCLLLVLAWSVKRVHAGNLTCPTFANDGVRALHLIAISYFFVQVGFVVLTSPPLGRFADAAAIFIPAAIAVLLVQIFRSNLQSESE